MTSHTGHEKAFLLSRKRGFLSFHNVSHDGRTKIILIHPLQLHNKAIFPHVSSVDSGSQLNCLHVHLWGQGADNTSLSPDQHSIWQLKLILLHLCHMPHMPPFVLLCLSPCSHPSPRMKQKQPFCLNVKYHSQQSPYRSLPMKSSSM